MDARQIEGESTAAGNATDYANLSAEQAGDLTTDRKAESCTAVLPRGGTVGLLKWFKDYSLFLRRNTDAGIVDRERDDFVGTIQRIKLILFISRRGLDLQRHLALLGKFESVRQKVVQNLQQRSAER